MKAVIPFVELVGLVLLFGTLHAPAEATSAGKVGDAASGAGQGAAQGAGQVVASLRAAEPQGSVSGGWLEDFEAAKALAAAQKRHMLLDFTGSDWCGWCIKLDKEVFEKPDFKAFSAQKLVLVKLDFPQRKAQDQKTKAQNASLQKKFRAEGFPTIVLLDPSGVELKRWSGFNPNLLNELKSKIGAK
jgi:protein disulfide-isomerase